MSNIDKQALRENFEAWAEEAGALPWGHLKKQRSVSGNYSVQIYTYMWHAWSACHESLLDDLEAKDKWIVDLESKQVKIKLPESFYPDGDIECPLVINEYQIIEAIVAAGCKPIAVCPRCKCELDLTHKHDGAHYCHAAGTGKGE
jgi:hypothetical protein